MGFSPISHATEIRDSGEVLKYQQRRQLPRCGGPAEKSLFAGPEIFF